MFLTQKVVLLRYIFLTRYCVHQTKIICQIYVPRKLMYQFIQIGPIVLVFHLLGLGFWMFRVFPCFSIIKRPASLIVTQFRRHVATTSLLRDKLPSPELVYFHFAFNNFQYFVINELNWRFHCISVFLFIFVFHFVPS